MTLDSKKQGTSDIEEMISDFYVEITKMRRTLVINLGKMEERLVLENKTLRQKGVPYLERKSKISSEIFEKIDRKRKSVISGKVNKEAVFQAVADALLSPGVTTYKYHGDNKAFVKNEVTYYFDLYFVYAGV